MKARQGSSESWTRAFSRRRLLEAAAGASSALAVGAACGRNTATTKNVSGPLAGAGQPRQGGTFTYYWNANPPALDPQFFATGATTAFACAVMNGLFRFKTAPDPQVSLNHELENDLALSAESADAVTWAIRLRPDARFHNVAPVNGHPVEAEDVKATFVRGVNSPQNPNRSVLGMIDPSQITTPDAHTIIFKLKYPYAPFASVLGSVQYGLIFPREVASGGYDPSKLIIGSGPFLFDAYTPDVGVTLKRNQDYYDKGTPYLDAVHHAIVPSTVQQLAQFSAGNLDILHVAQTDVQTATKSNPNAPLIKVAGSGGALLNFQMGDASSPFQDFRLRQAVSLALDRDAIGKALYAGQYEPCFAVNLSMGKWALRMAQLDSSVQQYYKFNLSQAKQLVEQTGASNLNLKLAYPSHAFGTDFDTVVQTIFNMLSALPWKLTLVPLDYNKDYLAGGKGYLYGYFPSDTIVCETSNPFPETDLYLYGYYHSQSARNWAHLHDSTLDGFIDKARGTTDVEARRQAYLDAQKRIASELDSVQGLPSGFTYTLVRPEVRGFNYVPETNSDGRAWAKIWLKA